MTSIICARFAAFSMLFASGCAMTLPAGGETPVDSAPAAGGLRAGAGHADITPRPGYSTFGHGPDSRVASGTWTRLEARAFYFETDKEPPVVVVSCDLQSMSTLLQRRVAMLVKDIVPAARLMIGAIHTHAAPAHYWEGAFYNDLTSTRFPGYDEGMVTELATRIAAAVKSAHDTARPARLRWVKTNVWGITRNRSFEPFLANTHYPDLGRQDTNVPIEDERHAIDPSLRLLEIEAVDPKNPNVAIAPIGLLSFFAMHPTVLPPTNHLFGADADGVAEREVERALRLDWTKRDPALAACLDAPRDTASPRSTNCPDPVVALVNTNEGDISPIRSDDTIDETMRVGLRLGDAIVHTHEGDANDPLRHATDWSHDVVLDFHSIDLTLPNARMPDGLALCDEGAIGLGVTLGGSDHPSSLVPLFSTDMQVTQFDARACQSPKAIFMSGGTYGLSTQVPVGLFRVGGTFISFVPAEMTITAGARLNQRVVEQAKSAGAEDAVVAGLSNGYIEYIATKEEYQFQHYEGASTLYGPSTADFFARVLGALAADMAGRAYGDFKKDLPVGHAPIDHTTELRYDPGPAREQMEIDRKELSGKPPKLGFVCSQRGAVPPRICVSWSDDGPANVPMHDAPWVEIVRDLGDPLHRPPAGRCTDLAGPPCAENLDDRGTSFLVRAVRDLGGGVWQWSAVFRPTPHEWDRVRTLGGVRFRIRAGANRAGLESQPIRVDSLPDECSTEHATDCEF